MCSVPCGGGGPDCHGIGALGRGIGLAIRKHGREIGDDGLPELSASLAVEWRELKVPLGVTCPADASFDDVSLLSPSMGVVFAFMATQSDILVN